MIDTIWLVWAIAVGVSFLALELGLFVRHGTPGTLSYRIGMRLRRRLRTRRSRLAAIAVGGLAGALLVWHFLGVAALDVPGVVVAAVSGAVVVWTVHACNRIVTGEW